MHKSNNTKPGITIRNLMIGDISVVWTLPKNKEGN